MEPVNLNVGNMDEVIKASLCGIPVTVCDPVGQPIAWLDGNGTNTVLQPSNVGKVVKIGEREYTVTWDGCKPDPMKNGSTKGRLLPIKGPRYVDSLTIYSHLATMTVEEWNAREAEAKKRAEYGIAPKEEADSRTRSR